MVRAFELALERPWAIQPDALETILRLARREGDPEAISLKAGTRLANTSRVQVRDGVAIVSVLGPIFRRANLMSVISGATSIDLLARDLQEAYSSSDVKAVLLEVDSPGGQANGIGEMAGILARMGKKKPTCAYIGGLGASAAYWLASACQEIVISESALVGSIGVVAAYQRGSGDEVEFVSSQSPKKRIDLDSEDGQADIQKVLDDLASVFVGDVARYRNTTEAKVLKDFGQGGVLVGRAALKAGMVDRIGTFETTLARLTAAGQGKGARAMDSGTYSVTAGLEIVGGPEALLMLGETAADDAGMPPVTHFQIVTPEALERVARLAPTALNLDEEEGPPTGLSFETQLDQALTAVERCLPRARELASLRGSQGRRNPLAPARRDQLDALYRAVGDLLEATRPLPDRGLLAELQRQQAEALRLSVG